MVLGMDWFRSLGTLQANFNFMWLTFWRDGNKFILVGDTALMDDYSIQLVFFNLQISLAFLIAAFLLINKTAAIITDICVFGSGLLGAFLFQFLIQDQSYLKAGLIAFELYSGFALYRGLHEFVQYSFMGNYMGTNGYQFEIIPEEASWEPISELLICYHDSDLEDKVILKGGSNDAPQSSKII